MPHACTEDQLVEQPANGLFAKLGWTIAVGNPRLDPLPKGEGEAFRHLTPALSPVEAEREE